MGYPWVNKIVSRKAARLKQFCSVPYEIQQSQLLDLVRYAEHTEIGKKYSYHSIYSIDDYRKRVPLHHYDDIKVYFEKTRNGEQNVFWPTDIHWFAKSSGTTSDKSKFIPVSYEGLTQCHFRGGKDVLAIYSELYPRHRLFSGKCLTLGGSHQMDRGNANVRQGDLSAIMIHNIPSWIQLFRAPQKKVALIADWEEKLEKLTREVVRQNITSFAGVPSWNLVLMKHILEVTGKKTLYDIWPRMELFMHGGVSFKPYEEQYRKILPSPDMHYMETYNASEGFFAIQNDLQDEGMLLMLDYGIFYEFIPVEHIHDEKPETCHIGEVELNKNYAVVISSNNGLWRYIIGDTVKFTSLFPHKIVITGRTRHFINAFGEELIVENAESALHEACLGTGAMITDYTAAPVFMSDTSKGAHEWVIEFEKEPDDMNRFSDLLDKALMKRNSDYEAKRFKSITIGCPIVRKVPRNTFYRWFEEKHKLGGQNKMPRLSNDRRYLEEVLKLTVS